MQGRRLPASSELDEAHGRIHLEDHGDLIIADDVGLNLPLVRDLNVQQDLSPNNSLQIESPNY